MGAIFFVERYLDGGSLIGCFAMKELVLVSLYMSVVVFLIG
jgi:hypothetical protein